MIRAGERGSRLTAALEQSAVHLEQEAELAASLRQALAYPLLLFVTGTISVGVILTVVVPRFAELLADTGEALPLATRVLLEASALGSQGSATILLGLLMVSLAFLAWLHHAGGSASLDRLLLRLPLIGPVRHSLAESE